ncbi:thiol protease/hemagglutinin PrtT [Soonwooa sp.]|uniref:thiol protease/hemagglutinin PrtT n=1 Tax=Soonwooa sp. TaxID=1938592 RepID=UPI0026097077|nr:thiol protease/hemagglutinin PrtT [Soonwooa sp.]
MRNLHFLVGLLMLFSMSTFAKQIDESTAKQVGESFFVNSKKLSKSKVNLNLVYKSKASAGKSQSNFFYVFNNSTDGFVIVAADDNVTPILGYSTEGKFNVNDIPINTKEWFDNYKLQIQYVIDHNIPASQKIKTEWANYINNIAIDNKTTSVNPLLTTKWNQSPYYNDACPYDTDLAQKSVTGCAATAMSQIMKFWNYPAKGTGFYAYNHLKFGTISSNFSEHSYDWNSMPNVVTSANPAVAQLNYDAGVSLSMDYSPVESGAHIRSVQDPNMFSFDYVLKNYFGYKNTLATKERKNYNSATWLNLLKTELDAGRPILYIGVGNNGGHAFVCDGYDNNNLLHFNWGWGGQADGYFVVDQLNPGRYNFSDFQLAVIGVEPKPTPATDYKLEIFSHTPTLSSTEIPFGDNFSITTDMVNYGTASFDGSYGAAIYDSNNNFIDFLEVKTATTLMPFYYQTGIKFNKTSSTTLMPGDYFASILSRANNDGWKFIEPRSYSNKVPFKIKHSADIETNSAFSITNNNGKLLRGEPVSINVDITNKGNSTYYGKYQLQLLNKNDGSIAQVIQTVDETSGLPSNQHYTGGKNFAGTITAQNGSYLLNIVYQPENSNTWTLAGSTSFKNPIEVIVQKKPLAPDQYEVNDKVEQATNLPVVFNNNQAIIATTNSNFHNDEDEDYYKVNLDPGYKYTITPSLQDISFSKDATVYTASVIYAYSTNGGGDWSKITTSEEASPEIILNNGGTLIFAVNQMLPGLDGTYLFDIAINREATLATNNSVSNMDNIKLYPNPAKDFVNVDLSSIKEKVIGFSIINNAGQVVKNIPSTNDKITKISLQGLVKGLYYIQIETEKDKISKKIIVQ